MRATRSPFAPGGVSRSARPTASPVQSRRAHLSHVNAPPPSAQPRPPSKPRTSAAPCACRFTDSMGPVFASIKGATEKSDNVRAPIEFDPRDAVASARDAKLVPQSFDVVFTAKL